MNISKREPTSLDDSRRDFLKSFDLAGKCIQVPPPKPKVKIGYTKSEDNLIAHYYYDIIEQPSRQNRLSFRFGNNNSCVFSVKKFEIHGNQFILTESVDLAQREFSISTGTDFTLQTSLKQLRAITMCSAFTPDCGSDKSTIILIEDVYCPVTKCSCKLCLHKKTFQSLGRSDYQCPQKARVCQGTIFF